MNVSLHLRADLFNVANGSPESYYTYTDLEKCGLTTELCITEALSISSSAALVIIELSAAALPPAAGDVDCRTLLLVSLCISVRLSADVPDKERE